MASITIPGRDDPPEGSRPGGCVWMSAAFALAFAGLALVLYII